MHSNTSYVSKMIFSHILLATLATTTSMVGANKLPQSSGCLHVETHINTGLSVNMVSSLIIGSQAAVLIDLPLAIPEARSLAAWVRNITEKPLAAVFTTHYHPDHYLSGGAFLEFFPDAKYYGNSNAIAHIKAEAPLQVRIRLLHLTCFILTRFATKR